MTLTPTSQRPTFTEQQRNDLKELGLFDEQIAALEERLPICGIALRKEPALTPVREKIKKIQSSLEHASTELSRFLSGDTNASGKEAFQRVVMADFEFHAALGKPSDGDTLENLLVRLSLPKAVLAMALKDIPSAQRRNNASSFYPIQEIENALMNGFCKHHNSIGTGKPMPPFMDSASFAKLKRFARVASIFYAALGYRRKNLERPIKRYLASKRRPARQQREPPVMVQRRQTRNKLGR